MNIIAEISRIEKEVRAQGLTVKEFLRRAGVDNSLWTRWKQGRPPLTSTWARIERAIERLRRKGKR